MFHTASILQRAALLVALVLTLAAAPAFAREPGGDGDLDWSRSLRAGQILDVRGLNGPVYAEPAEGRVARVIAVKKGGRRCDASEVRIEVVESAEGIMVCALYPRRDGKENECGDEEQSNQNCDVTVEFRVEVPAGVKFIGRTVNGEVKAEDLRGPADLTSVNGSIWVETSSWASASTVNGSIHASLGAERWDEAVDFQTVNGQIELELPREVSADVRGSLMNGSLHSDFPLSQRGRHGMRRVRGTLGEGGSTLDVTSVNGDLVLRSRS